MRGWYGSDTVKKGLIIYMRIDISNLNSACDSITKLPTAMDWKVIDLPTPDPLAQTTDKR